MAETDPDLEDAKRKRRRRGWLSLRALVVVAAAPLLFGLVAVVMMFDRDVTAPSWIKTTVIERASEALAGGSLDFDAMTVRVGRDLHPRVTLTETELFDADGVRLAAVDRIEGLLSPRGVLFEQAALFQEVILAGTEFRLRRDAGGGFALSFEVDEEGQQEALDLQGQLLRLDALFERPALIALEQVKFSDLSLVFEDDRAGRDFEFVDGDIALDLRGEETNARATLHLIEEGQKGAVVSAAFLRDRVQGTTAIHAEIEEAPADVIALQSAALAWLTAVDADVSIKADVTLDGSSNLGPVEAQLDLSAGVLRPTETATPVAFDEVTARLVYDPRNQSVQFSDVGLSTDWGGMHAQGQALLDIGADGLPSEIIMQLAMSDIVIDPPDVFEARHELDRASVDLRLRLDPFTVDIGQVVLEDDVLPVVASGEVSAGDDGWEAAVDFEVARTDPESVFAWWPIDAKPGARRWLTANVRAGDVTDLVGALRLKQGQAPNFSLGYEFDEAEVKFLKEVEPLTRGRGYASFVGNSFAIALSEGVVVAPQGGVLDFAGSEMFIPDFTVKHGPMQMELAIKGALPAALSTMDLKPFELMKRANLPVDVADGQVVVGGFVQVPMKTKMTYNEVDYAFEADINRVRSNRLVPNRDLRSVSLNLDVDRDGLIISGPARLSGVPVTARFEQTFGEGSTRRVTGQVELSQRFLDGFNIALPPGSIDGRGRADFEIALPKDQPPQFALSSNLRGVSVAIPALGWRLPEASEGVLSVEGEFAEPARIDRIEISGGGLNAVGAVRLRADGSLSQARFARVQLGNWLNTPITVRGRGSGVPVAIEMAGGTLDLRRAQLGGGDSADRGPLTLALDRLQITEGIALTNFNGEFDGTGGLSGEFRGRVNGQAEVRGVVAPRNGRSAVRIQSDDAGGAVAAAGFLKNGIGGTLDLTLLPTGSEGTFDGTLRIVGLRVRDAPAMAALLNAVSVVGLLQQLDGQGLAFEEVDAQFRLTPTQVIVTQSSAVGPGLGISLDGLYTLASKQMDFQGVISPVYLLNGIGSILTRKGEGLIGSNFSLRGASDAPSVAVNPLSALTPGMFREIFRRPAPQVGQ